MTLTDRLDQELMEAQADNQRLRDALVTLRHQIGEIAQDCGPESAFRLRALLSDTAPKSDAIYI